MNLRSPISRARGLGSAKEGVGHWWIQRLTAVALVPLTLWFVMSVVALKGADYATVQAWLGTPGNTTLMLALIWATFHHMQLGMQVVYEDYVSNEPAKVFAIVATKFIAAVLGIFCAVSVLKVAFGG